MSTFGVCLKELERRRKMQRRHMLSDRPHSADRIATRQQHNSTHDIHRLQSTVPQTIQRTEPADIIPALSSSAPAPCEDYQSSKNGLCNSRRTHFRGAECFVRSPQEVELPEKVRVEDLRWVVEQQAAESRRLRKEAREMTLELENRDFTVQTIQRNLQNVCRLQAADRQELMIYHSKEPRGSEFEKLRRELRESEESRRALVEEVDTLRSNNILLQQKVCLLRDSPSPAATLADERIYDCVDAT
eukprot:GEMP01080249.1.p1 GENE.GEMP01080249.1~~GEMP01080249.1.p1  ORF type:complete len:245 (+),score=52.36 GEMP01080249.1:61-795(+)